MRAIEKRERTSRLGSISLSQTIIHSSNKICGDSDMFTKRVRHRSASQTIVVPNRRRRITYPDPSPCPRSAASPLPSPETSRRLRDGAGISQSMSSAAHRHPPVVRETDTGPAT